MVDEINTNELNFEPLNIKIFEEYHQSFQGDTFNACKECGGKCEKYKISTLYPGEKEYIAKTLKMKVEEVEYKYLDRIDTPLGIVEVIKMKDGCPLLDKELHCSTKSARPILCDSYPIFFEIKGNKVVFDIDIEECPMASKPENNHIIDNFRKKGIPAIQKIPAPLKWYQAVFLFDPYDFDYVLFEKITQRESGYQTFMVEDVLAFACNGFEKKARKLGIKLMDKRLQSSFKNAVKNLKSKKIKKGSYTELLLNTYFEVLNEKMNKAKNLIDLAKNDKDLLEFSNYKLYLTYIHQLRFFIELFSDLAESFLKRLAEFEELEALPIPANKSKKITNIDPIFYPNPQNSPKDLDTFEVTQGNSKDAFESYCLLSRCFLPDELDSPKQIYDAINDGFIKRKTDPKVMKQSIDVYIKWIVIIARDQIGRIIAVSDGSLLVENGFSMFYASHIATKPDLRSHGIGTWLTAAIVHVANETLIQESKKYKINIDNAKQPMIMCEITEVDFPNKLIGDTESLMRLKFHGRVGRQVIWPLRYAQPDTDFNPESKWSPDIWNSVPMFLSIRIFGNHESNVDLWLKSVDVLWDYFTIWHGQGAEFDRIYCKKYLNKEQIKLISFPTSEQEIEEFIRKTGWASDLLLNMYPDSKYTKDRLKMLKFAQ